MALPSHPRSPYKGDLIMNSKFEIRSPVGASSQLLARLKNSKLDAPMNQSDAQQAARLYRNKKNQYWTQGSSGSPNPPRGGLRIEELLARRPRDWPPYQAQNIQQLKAQPVKSFWFFDSNRESADPRSRGAFAKPGPWRQSNGRPDRRGNHPNDCRER